MADYSFDIVSDYDKTELNNVFGQTQREIDNRYDFKNTPAQIEWLNNEKTGLKIIGNSEWQIDAILEIVRKKLAARNQSQKVLDTSNKAILSNLQAIKVIPFKQGLNQENAKKITGIIREQYPKIKTQIQGDSIRINSNSKDDLQGVMKLLNQQDFDFPLNYMNFR